MAIRLGYEKRGADLEAFVENTGNHCGSWAPRPATETRVGGRSGPERSALALGPDLRSGTSLGSAAAPAMAPLCPANPGVAVACCWFLTGERSRFYLSISCVRGLWLKEVVGVGSGGRYALLWRREKEGALIHFRALQVVWAGWNTETSFCVSVLIRISFDVVSKPSTPMVGGREAVLKT